jgi:hypothetical protein
MNDDAHLEPPISNVMEPPVSNVMEPPVFRPAVVALVIACLFAAAAGPQQVRDNMPPVAAGTASISGTVVLDGTAKRPARRARVTLTSIERTSPGRTTTTDDRGAFSFPGVPAGRFELQAFKAGYLKGSYGASRPNRAGTPIVVSEGQTIADLTMTMARGGVITGVVRDARGRPLPGVGVRVLKLGYHPVTGERTLAAQSTASTSTTDDRGEYRAYGLPPGGYLVLVPGPPRGRSGFSGTDDIRPLTADDVRRAMQMAQARMPAAAIASPAAGATVAPSTPVRVSYAPVFHPGVTNIGAAATIALGVSEERTGVDVTVELVPTATISGTVSSPSGDLPQGLSIRLVPAGADASMLAGAGLRGSSTPPAADGSYVMAGVAPGMYTIKATISLGGGRGGVPVPNAPTMWAAADVQVSGQDLEVPLTLQPGVPIDGRVVFEGSRPSPAELQTLSFQLVPPGAGGTALWTGGGRVDAEGRFTFASVPPDTYQVVTRWTTPGAEERWTIKASTANSRDAFESPLRIDPGQPVEWTVTFTDNPSTLTGVLQDRGGRAATDYYVVVFPSDRAHWTPGSRRIRMMRPATDGAFGVRGLPPGEYLVAALTDLEPGEWNDPALLAQLVAASARVTLRAGETTKQDFRIGGL